MKDTTYTGYNIYIANSDKRKKQYYETITALN